MFMLIEIVTFLVAVIMTGVTTVLCCKLRSQSSTNVQRLVAPGIEHKKMNHKNPNYEGGC